MDFLHAGQKSFLRGKSLLVDLIHETVIPSLVNQIIWCNWVSQYLPQSKLVKRLATLISQFFIAARIIRAGSRHTCVL